jgi:hypothetical protein
MWDGGSILAILAIVAAWSFFAYTVWRWGPGRRRHSVRCPEKNRRARVVVERQESGYGTLLVTDIAECSLLPDGSVSCGKECLRKF